MEAWLWLDDWDNAVMSGAQGNKESCGWQSPVCHPGKAQVVIIGRGRGHLSDKAPPLAIKWTNYLLRSLAGLLLRWWWVEMKVQYLSIDSDMELWSSQRFYQGLFDSNSWAPENRVPRLMGCYHIVDNRGIEKWLKSCRIWKITTQVGSYPQWQS